MAVPLRFGLIPTILGGRAARDFLDQLYLQRLLRRRGLENGVGASVSAKRWWVNLGLPWTRWYDSKWKIYGQPVGTRLPHESLENSVPGSLIWCLELAKQRRCLSTKIISDLRSAIQHEPFFGSFWWSSNLRRGNSISYFIHWLRTLMLTLMLTQRKLGKSVKFVHTHLHTYTYTLHTHTHTHIHTYTQIQTHTYTHTDTHTYRYTHIHTYIQTHTHTPTYIHTYIHTYTQTYIHAYIHTYIITVHYITVHYITLQYITLHYIHTNGPTYMHACIHACMHAYIHRSQILPA